MDALSQLLALCRGEVQLDVRCLLGGNFSIPHEPRPRGEAVFHLMLSGTCQLHMPDGKSCTLSPGDFVLLPQGDAHTLANISSTDKTPAGRLHIRHNETLPVKYNTTSTNRATVELVCGRFLFAQSAAVLLMQNLPSVMEVNLQETPGIEALRALIHLLRREATDRQPGAWAIANSLAHSLLAYAMRAFGKADAAQAAWFALTTDERLSASVQAMLAEPERAWSLESLGDIAAMSRATYARQFKEKSGMTPGEALLAIRMMHASKLMLQTRRTVGDIAQAVGYQSEAAFGKAFRQALGSTPAQWRKAQAREQRT